MTTFCLVIRNHSFKRQGVDFGVFFGSAIEIRAGSDVNKAEFFIERARRRVGSADFEGHFTHSGGTRRVGLRGNQGGRDITPSEFRRHRDIADIRAVGEVVRAHIARHGSAHQRGQEHRRRSA